MVICPNLIYILNHSISLLVCAHGSPPFDQGEGQGVGLHVIDYQRHYSLLQYPTPGPSPQKREGNCMAWHSWFIFSYR